MRLCFRKLPSHHLNLSRCLFSIYLKVDEVVKKEKKDLLYCIASLDTDITKCSFEAEKKKDFTLLTIASVFRKSKTEKQKSVAAVDVAFGKLENDLNTLE